MTAQGLNFRLYAPNVAKAVFKTAPGARWRDTRKGRPLQPEVRPSLPRVGVLINYSVYTASYWTRGKPGRMAESDDRDDRTEFLGGDFRPTGTAHKARPRSSFASNHDESQAGRKPSKSSCVTRWKRSSDAIRRAPSPLTPPKFPDNTRACFAKTGKWGVEDLASTNGTFVNGVRVDDAWLSDGDEMRLATIAFRFEADTPMHGQATALEPVRREAAIEREPASRPPTRTPVQGRGRRRGLRYVTWIAAVALAVALGLVPLQYGLGTYENFVDTLAAFGGSSRPVILGLLLIVATAGLAIGAGFVRRRRRRTPDDIVPTEGADVFVSYSRADSRKALRLVGSLRDRGISVWLDQQNVDGAQFWGGEIARAVNEAKVVLLLVSRSAYASRQVRREIALASEAGKPILPICLEKAEMPPEFRFFLAGIHQIDWAEDNVETILRALARFDARGPDHVPSV